ncbi:hypothetical protein LTR67_000394 [Exophiala xenobiotica]
MTFKLPRAAENLFSTLTSQSADILTYLEGPPAYAESPGSRIQTDLFAKVKRHEKFMDDAHESFMDPFTCFEGLSGTILHVQTHDLPFGVELIWNTHKLYPRQYQLFHQGITPAPPAFTDSKSPIPSPFIVDAGLEQTRRPASECYCWACERTRDDLPAFSYDKSATTAPAYDKFLVSTLSSEQLRSIQDDLGFYRAVEEARSRRLPLPTRPPTAAEKAAEKLEAKKQAAACWLPGLNEYLVTLPNGKKKIKRVKYASTIYGMSVV